MSRATLASIVVLVALAAPSGVAHATSCVDVEARLVGAEAAFVGTVTERDGDLLTSDVGEVFRGDLPDPFVVRDALSSVGDAFEVGAEVGLTVYRQRGELLVNECGLVPPARLRQARAEGWPRGLLDPQRRRLVARDRGAELVAFCSARCAGTLALRGADGVVLGLARVALDRGSDRIELRLTGAARRRLARVPRLSVRLVVRLAPAMSPVEHRLTLVRGRG